MSDTKIDIKTMGRLAGALSTVEAGFRLMLHGIDAENLYGFIKHVRDSQDSKKTLETKKYA